MKLISTKVHGLLDYITGFLLIGSPWLFNFATGGPEMWVPIILGIMLLLGSMVTRYEAGIVKLVPMKIHIVFDIVFGLFLACSPWLFGFSEFVFLPHLLIGILEVLVALMSDRHPRYAIVEST